MYVVRPCRQDREVCVCVLTLPLLHCCVVAGSVSSEEYKKVRQCDMWRCMS